VEVRGSLRTLLGTRIIVVECGWSSIKVTMTHEHVGGELMAGVNVMLGW